MGSTPSTEDVKREIAREMIKLHEDSYGQAAFNLEVAIEPSLVVAMMDIELSEAETTLIEAGNQDSVKNTREAFQIAISPTFRAIVERATGHIVDGFASRTILDPVRPWSVEVFRLRNGATAT